MTSHSTLERNGFVFLWYHAEGIDPVWEPPEIDEVASGQWKYCGRSEHFVNAHIEVRRRDLNYERSLIRFSKSCRFEHNFAFLQSQPKILPALLYSNSLSDSLYGGMRNIRFPHTPFMNFIINCPENLWYTLLSK